MVEKSRNALSEEIILISRGIAIYKVGASPYWQCRVRDSRTKKYVVRSTKETSRIKARLAAEEIAAEIRGSVKRVEREFTFEAYGKRMIQKADRALGEKLGLHLIHHFEGFELGAQLIVGARHEGGKPVLPQGENAYVKSFNELGVTLVGG